MTSARKSSARPKLVRHRRHTSTVHLTIEERDMLLAHGDPSADFDEIFRGAHVHGSLVCLGLEPEVLTEFLRAFELTANSAQNSLAMERLGYAFARIEAGFDGEVDPGWHMLRPALSGLELSPKQGQYLAFIHAYTRVHRCAPAESEIEDYFRTTPPSVHSMLQTLQKRGFISRRAGEARSTTVLLAAHEIPELE